MLLLFWSHATLAAAAPSITLAFSARVVTDSFDRDTAGALGTADSGQVWSNIRGAWGIADNQAASIGAVAPNAFATLDSGIADGIIQVTVSPTDAAHADEVGVSLRVQDSDNGIFFRINPGAGTVSLFQTVASVGTTLATGTYTVSASNVLKVFFVGPTVECYVDGVLAARTDQATALTTITKHGLAARNEPPATRWNDFSITRAVWATTPLRTAIATPSIRFSVLAIANPFGLATPSIRLTLAPAASSTRGARATPSIRLVLAPVSRVTAFAVSTPRITLALGVVASQKHAAHASPSIRLALAVHTIGGYIRAGSSVIELEYNASGTTLTGSQEITFREGGVSTLTLSQRE